MPSEPPSIVIPIPIRLIVGVPLNLRVFSDKERGEGKLHENLAGSVKRRRRERLPSGREALPYATGNVCRFTAVALRQPHFVSLASHAQTFTTPGTATSGKRLLMKEKRGWVDAVMIKKSRYFRNTLFLRGTAFIYTRNPTTGPAEAGIKKSPPR